MDLARRIHAKFGAIRRPVPLHPVPREKSELIADVNIAAADGRKMQALAPEMPQHRAEMSLPRRSPGTSRGSLARAIFRRAPESNSLSTGSASSMLDGCQSETARSFRRRAVSAAAGHPGGDWKASLFRRFGNPCRRDAGAAPIPSTRPMACGAIPEVIPHEFERNIGAGECWATRRRRPCVRSGVSRRRASRAALPAAYSGRTTGGLESPRARSAQSAGTRRRGNRCGERDNGSRPINRSPARAVTTAIFCVGKASIQARCHAGCEKALMKEPSTSRLPHSGAIVSIACRPFKT